LGKILEQKIPGAFEGGNFKGIDGKEIVDPQKDPDATEKLNKFGDNEAQIPFCLDKILHKTTVDI